MLDKNKLKRKLKETSMSSPKPSKNAHLVGSDEPSMTIATQSGWFLVLVVFLHHL